MRISADCIVRYQYVRIQALRLQQKQEAGLGELELDQNISIRLIVVMHTMHRVANNMATPPKALLKLPAPVKC